MSRRVPLVTTDPPAEAQRCAALRESLPSILEGLSTSGPIGVRLVDVACTSLGNICGADVCGAGDRVAGVLARCDMAPEARVHRSSSDGREVAAGAAPIRMGLFAMESEDAFSLMRGMAAPEELLETYVGWGSRLVAEAARALAPGFPSTQPAAASLEEDSVISILVATHAPSDTVVATLVLELSAASGEASAPGFVYLLVDPKSFGATAA